MDGMAIGGITIFCFYPLGCFYPVVFIYQLGMELLEVFLSLVL